MKQSLLISLLIICIFLDKSSLADLLSPPQEKPDLNAANSGESNTDSINNDRKSAKGLLENDGSDTEDSSNEKETDEFAEFVTNEMNFPGSAIKIVKAPDLSKDKDSKKVSETITILLENQEKWIQKIESELDEMNKDEPQLEQPPKEKTPDEIEADSLYDSAMSYFNKSRSDKTTGFALLHKAADKGHKLAKAQIAWAHLLGNPGELKIEYAKNILLELAESGMPEAHIGLGFMYAAGVGFNVSQAKALVHYTMAALGDNSFGQMVLGYRYWAGISVPNSCEKALDFYRKVATKVASEVTFSGGPAVLRVRLLDEVENSGPSSGIFDNDLIEYYQLLADKGDVQAQVGLGQLHYQGGRGIPLDHRKALSYLTPAANAGNAVAMAFLGKIYLEGSENIKADNETAYKYFKKAADLGNPIGQSGLGIMYLQGKGVPKDTEKALKYFTQAADQGWVDGQLQLGNMYYHGIGVKKDYKLANKYFNLASQSGHVLAFFNLAQMHASGVGMMRSCPTAVELFKNVAERGKWSERLMIAYHDYRAYRYDEAFMQYAFMSELGYEVAQSNAAFLLDRSEMKLFNNRDEDLVRALQYWGRAAAQGYSAAQVKLGDYHYYGMGTSVDYETAATHYRMAAEQQHNAQAMFNLGYMHEQGLGMKKDIHLAKRSYDLAAETNADAKIPVALALLKLQLVYKLDSWQKDNPFRILMNLDENIASNWDLYLITLVTLLIGIIVYSRRPPNQPLQENQPQERRDNNEEEQPLVNPPSPTSSSSSQEPQNQQTERVHDVQ